MATAAASPSAGVFAANDQMALGAIQAIAARKYFEEVRGKLGGTGRGLDG
jgi:ABC-type sugar transport system substrate-binding protein